MISTAQGGFQPISDHQGKQKMTHAVQFASETRLRSRNGEQRSFHRLVNATLVFFLAAAVLRRIFGNARPIGGARPSLLAEARASASAVIPFIFMG
jgi:hypothetical protein